MKAIRKSILLPAFVLMAGAVYAQPAVTAVLDGAALTPNLAQGSVFVVKGTNLSTGNEFFQATAPTYPTSFHNVSISLTPTGGGASIPMLMVYVYNLSGVNQLAGVVPSTTATGNYNLKVAFNGASSTNFATTIVARKPGVVTADGSGLGIAQATINGGLTLQRVSVLGKIGDFDTRPAHPNDVITLWGTGIGADSASDSGGSGGDQTAAGNIRVVFNGADITPSYAGRSFGYPGLDQVNFTLPNDVALKCDNTVQVRAGGVVSNSSTIATSAANATSCPATNTGGGGGTTISQTDINTIIASGKFRSGNLSVTRSTSYIVSPNPLGGAGTTTTSVSDSGSASFVNYAGTGLSNYLGTVGVTTYGACTVVKAQGTTTTIPNVTFNTLDAGASIGLSGPNGNKTLVKDSTAGFISYSATLGSTYLDPGSYTMNVPGGANVGAFTITAPMPPSINWTNRTSLTTVNRSNGVTFNWTGGDSAGVVSLIGTSIATSGGSVAFAAFSCTAKTSDGQFTVPGSILAQLPATAAISAGGLTIYTTLGTLSITAEGAPVRAGAVSGLDYALFSAGSSISQSTIFQ